MNTLILFLLFIPFVHATDIPVTLRNQKQKLTVEKVDFSGKLQGPLAVTDHFMVLNAMDQEAMDFSRTDSSPDDLLRAGTVLYHLAIAREYFVSVLDSQYVRDFPVIKVRLNMTKPFNEYFHFVKESKQDQFNNAVSVPPSGSKKSQDVAPWDSEIWFRPSRVQEIPNSVFQSSKLLDQMNLTPSVVGAVIEQGIVDGGTQSSDYVGYLNNLLWTLGIFEVAPKVLQIVSQPFNTSMYMDTALIPEVIYHEFTHVALSDHVSLKRSGSVNEGMANYFAAVISGGSKIAMGNGKHSKNIQGYEGKKKLMYDQKLETEKAAHSGFVFSFLWRLRSRFMGDLKDGNLLADKLVFASRKHLRYSDKPIKDDLVPALITAVEDVFPKQQSRLVRMMISEVAIETGI